jgi:hypothetical protein
MAWKTTVLATFALAALASAPSFAQGIPPGMQSGQPQSSVGSAWSRQVGKQAMLIRSERDFAQRHIGQTGLDR